MRLGGPVFGDIDTPESWVQLVKEAGFRAAFCPVNKNQDDATIASYAEAAAEADIVIAEVGAWSNTISPDEEERQKNLQHNKDQLALADKVGACCCVNIAGSRNTECWHGPSPEDLTEETFELIVRTVQEIIDEVQPTRSFYTLETMPWCPPDSADSYVRLIETIDRERFAVHMDPTNLVSSPRRYAHNGEVIKECFDKLGPHIKSCHAKDISLSSQLMVHLDEVRAGLGVLDYRVFLTELDKLDPDIPIMMEHLPNAEEYKLAGAYIRSVAEEVGVAL